ncbi:MAG: flavodoxin [Clostridia bacterium]|nr:flavodoxin [Clostridia bacterium]
MLALMMSSCAEQPATQIEENTAAPSVTSAPITSAPITAAPTKSVQPAQSAQAPETEPPTPTESEPPTEASEPPTHKSGVLVLYFSATGNTKLLADRIAKLEKADIAEIVPAQPYTAEDLNYHDPSTRASAEQNDPSARPAIAEEISLEGYSAIFLGYPIWWGKAPRILNTFVEANDLTGITVIPFCTSGSSDIGASDDELAALAGSGNWLQGKRFALSVTNEELLSWIGDSLGE